MPETSKPDGRDEGHSETQPGVGVIDEAGHPADSMSPEAQGGQPPLNGNPFEESPVVEEAAHEPPPAAPGETGMAEAAGETGMPDVAGETEMQEFAESIKSSLEQAGIDIEDGEHSEHQTGEVSLPEDEDGFFAGWPGLVAEEHPGAEEEGLAEEQEAVAPQPFEELAGHNSLSEISLASVAMLPAEDESASAAISIKHDELADAVQSALLSVYGDQPGPAGATAGNADYSSEAPPPAGAGWMTPPGVAASDDNLTPQEVILNYFSYDPNARNGAGQTAELNRAGSLNDEFERRDVYPSASQQWPDSPAQHASYEGAPAYPVPAGFTTPPKGTAASDRESSRLLGAAAIGLVGGIAIAASLAVFVINSYGPGLRTGEGANRAFDATDTGYGRPLRTGPDGQAPKDAPVPSLAAQEPAIIAADVVATPGRPSALAIGVKSEVSADQTLVSITGVPEGARLNAGVDAGGGNWLLPPRRLNGLTINLPANASDSVLVGVQLLDSNVRTPLSEMKQFVIRVSQPVPESATLVAVPQVIPVDSGVQPETKTAQAVPPFFSTETVPVQPVRTVPPEPQTPPEPNFRTLTVPAPGHQGGITRQSGQPRGASQAEIEDLIREGNKRMREGDILEARQLYQKAVALGDPEAALAMGRSYDPIYFARLDKKNSEPDAAKAFDWYRRAMDGGAAQTAKVRIENLKHFLNE